MFQTYGLYKYIRNSTWQVLLDNFISELPVDVVSIAVNNNITILKNSVVHELHNGEDGVSIFDENNWFIIYNDLIKNLGRKRFTIAHELGHIFLGHPLIAGYHKRTLIHSNYQIESQANMFAARLLAPACVLWGLNLHTADEIAHACNISLTAAEFRAKRMEELYRRNKFLTDPLEKQLYLQFQDFIKKQKS